MTDWLERNRGFILVTLINLALVGGLFFWLRRPDPNPVEIVPPTPTTASVATPTVTPSPLRVYVTGAVLHPDVYRLAPACIVKDAIEAAGGAADDADLNRVNLAQELRDQQQLYVPRIGETDVPPPVMSAEPASPVRSSGSGGTININTASIEELDTLPGIGPAIAQRIIDYREANGPFKSLEEIKSVSGIGDATYEKIKDRITVND